MAMTIGDLFEHAADLCGQRTALISGARTVSYAELNADTNRLASYLISQGVRPGDKVGVYCRNSIECVAAMLAAYKARAVAVNINYRYVAGELAYILDNSDAVALFCEQRFLPVLSAVAAGATVPATIVVPDDTGCQATGFAAIGHDDALAAGTPAPLDLVRDDDDVYMLYTGGTTGAPKGVLWRHEDIFRVLGGGIDFYTGTYVTDEWQIARAGAAQPRPALLPIPPMIHATAQWSTFQSLFAGGTIVLEPAFDPARVWELIETHRIATVVVAGDAIARPLIETHHPGAHDISSLAVLISTGALFSHTVKHQYLDAFPGLLVIDATGSSETGFSGMTMVRREDRQDGGPRVRPAGAIHVLDDAGQPVAAGEVGRLARSGHVPLGYHKDPAKSAATFVSYDGVRYALPGDAARLESDGTITVLGRGSNCINSAGEKVFPEEVEGALKAHPGVFDVLVVGVDDDRLGQRVAALIQPRPGHDITLTGLADTARDTLARYKLPRSLWLVDQIKRSPAGKPDYPWARALTTSTAPTEERRARAGTVTTPD